MSTQNEVKRGGEGRGGGKEELKMEQFLHFLCSICGMLLYIGMIWEIKYYELLGFCLL